MQRKTELDPFRTILAAISAAKNSDTLVQAVGFAGINFDGRVSEAPGVSHGMRIRSLLPRIQAAYDSLPQTDQLLAANAMLRCPALQDTALSEQVAAALVKIGWSIADGQLLVASAEIREMFFPKGTQWDAFVVLTDIMAGAKSHILVIDAYCNADLFSLLPSRTPLTLQVLCSKEADTLAVAAVRYSAQHPGITISVRKTKDFHDRFVVLDHEVCVHVGASLKDAGKTAFMVNRIEDDLNRQALLSAATRAWEAATPVR